MPGLNLVIGDDICIDDVRIVSGLRYLSNYKYTRLTMLVMCTCLTQDIRNIR